MRLFVSQDASRYVLNGVFFEVTEGYTLMVATDGRILAAMESQCHHDGVPMKWDGEPAARFVVPIELLERLHIAKTPWGRDDVRNAVSVEFDSDKNAVRLTQSAYGVTLTGDTIDGDYPKWTQVLLDHPVEKATAHLCLNSNYLSAIGSAVGFLTNSSVPSLTLIPGETHDSPVVVRVENLPLFYVVLMGCRNHAPTQRPAWIGKHLKAAEDAKPTETQPA